MAALGNSAKRVSDGKSVIYDRKYLYKNEHVVDEKEAV